MILEAMVFNIQSFSLHDGPGIRTTVFFKGCPLRCLWCHNPESHQRVPELLFYDGKCTGCGACAKACPYGAVIARDGKAVTDRNLCQGCGQCVTACPEQAREISGKWMSQEEIMAAIRRDRIFYDSSGGGVTFSGGEPLVWTEMLTRLAKQCRCEGMHTAIETSGYGLKEQVLKTLENIDLVFFDLKAMDGRLHTQLTGVPNDRILENARGICHILKKKMVIRIPVIPGYNDDEENIRQTAAFIKESLSPKVSVQLMPYHNLGTAKAQRLGWNHKKPDTIPLPKPELLEKIKAQIEEYGLIIEEGI